MSQNLIQKTFYSSKMLQKIYYYPPITKILHKIPQFFIFCNAKGRMILQRLSEIPRRCGFNQKKYLPIKSYKNKYEGKRCFITCTGPSLTIEDLESLKNEYVFGMNSICLIHEKTDWRPDFYGVQDEAVYEKLQEVILNSDNGVVFLSQELEKYKTPANYVPFYIEGYYHWYEFLYRTRYFSYFSDDCYVRVFDGYTITYSLIQIAVYMGFKDIYLLGADCNYLGSKEHFIDTGVSSATAAAGERLIATYKDAKLFAQKYGFNIYNATRGGKLEVFPRVKLEDVLSNSVQNKIN